MSNYYQIFHSLDHGVMKTCTEMEWEQCEARLDPVVMESRIGSYSVQTMFESAEQLHSGQRSQPFHIKVTGNTGEFVLPQSSFPHRIVYDYLRTPEEAKLAHFALVRFLEHLTKEKASSTMARRAVHNTYWDPDDGSAPDEFEMRECRVVDDRLAPDP